MTTRGPRMTEKERGYAICLMIPLLWPLALGMLICDVVEWIGRRINPKWRGFQ